MSQDFEKRIQLLAEQKKFKNEVERDYVLRRIRSNLFFDDDAKIDYLASLRFPNDPLASYRYEIQDGELMYRDDNNVLQPEFDKPEGVGFFGDTFKPNIVPAGTFAADVYGGIKGAKMGFRKGLNLATKLPIKHPVAQFAVVLGSTALGGFGGNFVVGGGARTAREALIEGFYDLPPEEIAAAYNDLLISSGFSSIPFGVGKTRQVLNKFIGRNDDLNRILNLRRTEADVIDEAKKLGIDLTPAEASTLATNARSIQYFLSRQPEADKIFNFYSNRASQVREAIEVFANEIGSGKGGDIGRRVQEASESALIKLAKKRKDRASKLYNTLRGAEEPFRIDTNQIISKADKMLENKALDPNERTAIESFKNLLKDADDEVITDLMDIHARRSGSINDLIRTTDGYAKKVIIGLKDEMTELMDQATPLYNLARRVYDPSKPALQLMERSAIGKLSKLIKDEQSAKALTAFFNPNVSTQSLRNAKRVLQASDPVVFQDVKKEFVLQQLDKFSKEFLLEEGLPQFKNYFLQGNTKNMMKEVLDPEEFDNFYNLIEVMNKAFSIQKTGSPTQPLLAIKEKLTQDAKSLPVKATSLILSAINLPGRIVQGRFGEDVVKKISMNQAEAYYQALTDALFDPQATNILETAYDYFAPLEYGLKQTATRGVVEGVEGVTQPESQPYEGKAKERLLEDIQKDNLQGQLDSMLQSFTPSDIPLVPPATAVTPEMMLSETILPDPADREILERRMRGTGIGSLA